MPGNYRKAGLSVRIPTTMRSIRKPRVARVALGAGSRRFEFARPDQFIRVFIRLRAGFPAGISLRQNVLLPFDSLPQVIRSFP